jgi:hypothetical protein
MLIGAYGTFWERGLVDWLSYNWRPLGRQGLKRGDPDCRIQVTRGVCGLAGRELAQILDRHGDPRTTEHYNPARGKREPRLRVSQWWIVH